MCAHETVIAFGCDYVCGTQVDTFIHGFLRQEGVEKRLKENFEEMVQAFEALEAERRQWRDEEVTAQKQIAGIRAQLAAKSREIKRVEANERAAMEELRVRVHRHAGITQSARHEIERTGWMSLLSPMLCIELALYSTALLCITVMTILRVLYPICA
jgi:hypothetical protein